MYYTFPSGPLDTNAYVLVDESSKSAFLIDPGFGSFAKIDPWLTQKGLGLTGIGVTHSHWDHVGDAHLFLNKFKELTLYVHPLDQENILHPGTDGLVPMLKVEPLPPQRVQPYPSTIEVGSFQIEVLNTPGHSPGCVCLWVQKKKLLFSGDTLFAGTYGYVHLPTSSRQDMIVSLKKLADLPQETRVYPGHGHATTIGEERHWMVRLRYTQTT